LIFIPSALHYAAKSRFTESHKGQRIQIVYPKNISFSIIVLIELDAEQYDELFRRKKCG